MIRRAILPLVLLLLAGGLGFGICYWLDRRGLDAPISPAEGQRLGEGGFVPPSPGQPERPAGVPHETPVLGSGTGVGPYRRPPPPVVGVVGVAGQAGASPGGPLPGSSSCPAAFSPTPADLRVKCDPELVGPAGAPWLRIWGNACVQLPGAEVCRGSEALDVTDFHWATREAAPAQPTGVRSLVGLSAGITTGPGYELGTEFYPAGWALSGRWAEARVGLYARIEQDALEARAALGASVLWGVGKR